MAIEKAKQDSIVKALHVRVMDFKTNNASNLEACFLQLAQMFDNVLHNPDNAKFKQVRANNPMFKKTVLDAVKHIDEFLCSAGWKTKVHQFEKFWMFDATPNDTAWRCLEFARQELQSALALVRTKLEQKACEQTERVEGSTKERQRILLQLEDDKAARVHRQHRTTVNKLSEGN